ncbi:MAG: hypothetical protein WC464_03770 [Bdellovibrionales bacterium]
MALRFIDGFDHYTTLTAMAYKWTSFTYNPTPNTAGRRSGSLAVSTGNSSFTKTLDSQSIWILGFAFKASTVPTGDRAFVSFFDSSSSVQIEFDLSTGLLIKAYRGGGVTLLATATAALVPATWCYLEFKITIADSSGIIEVRKDGVTILSYTGDTKYSSSLSTACNFWLGGGNGSGTYIFDDLYICDGTGTINNDFLGDVRVDTLYPTAAGASAQFTPVGDATNYSNVDDATPDTDTTYNYADTADYSDSFVCGDVSTLGATVYGVQANLLARKDDAGTRTIAALSRISGTNYAGAALALSDSYVNLPQIWQTNPATSSAWTESSINGAEFGYKVVA